MTSERWQQVKQIFGEAMRLDAADRAAYLAETCAGDEDLRGEVEKLLNSYETDFLERPRSDDPAQAPLDQNPQLTSGQRLNQYEVLKPIGAGGMGMVYLAQDTRLRRRVALKLLPHQLIDNQEYLLRFEQEARAASALNHPNILTIHEIGESDSGTFIAAEFVDGQTLRQRMRDPMSLTDVLDVAIQTTSALAAAHRAGIVHRDIKPENIMIRPDGIVKVLDFGLAKALINRGSASDDDFTRPMLRTTPGLVMGTINYMSPEQARGLPVDARTDIWSLGVVLYELVAGRKPFSGDTTSDVIAEILRTRPLPLKEIAPETPDELQQIVNGMLQAEKEMRYQNANDLLNDLQGLRDELKYSARRERDSIQSGEQSQKETATVTDSAATRVSSRAQNLTAKLSSRRRLAIIFLGAFAVLFAIGILSSRFLFSNSRAIALTDKDTILITDFTNSTGDSVFDGTLKRGLALQLGQSPFLNIFPDVNVRETLRQMEQPQDQRITVEIGREICERNNLKALIAGSIAPFGSHYVITLEAINAKSGEVFERAQEEAGSKEAVLSTLSKAASEIREKLGETLSSIQKSDIPLFQLTTTSLEALQSFALAFDLSNRGKYFDSIPLFRHSTELDPNFGYGYSLLAGNYAIINDTGRSAENAAKAFALKDRATDREKLYITGAYYTYSEGDLDKAIETFGISRQSYPNDFRPSGNISLDYLLEGQFDKTVDFAKESIGFNPNISAWHVTLGTALLRLDRYAEAKDVFEKALQRGLDDTRLHSGLYALGFINHDEAGMQKQLDWSRGQPDEYVAVDWQANVFAHKGQWRQTQAFSSRSIELATHADIKGVAARYAAEQALRAAVLGHCEAVSGLVSQSLALQRNAVSLPRAALALALCGQSSQTQPLIDELSKQHPRNTLVNGLWLPTIRAALEIQRGNTSGAIEQLQPALRYEAAAEFWPQYIRGLALLKMNNAAEAAGEFQKIIDRRGQAPLSILYSLAKLGLARAAAATGESAKSRQSYEDFLTTWKDADSDLSLLKQARDEYGKLK